VCGAVQIEPELSVRSYRTGQPVILSGFSENTAIQGQKDTCRLVAGWKGLCPAFLKCGKVNILRMNCREMTSCLKFKRNLQIPGVPLGLLRPKTENMVIRDKFLLGASFHKAVISRVHFIF
jgi:hypothetical protein